MNRALQIWLEHPWRLRFLALGLAVLMTVVGALLWRGPLHQLDERTGSAVWSWGAGAQERRVVVVDVDEKSIQALGPWPWPRERTALLLKRLDQAGVSLKLLDILFDSPRPGDDPLRRALASPIPTVTGELFALDGKEHYQTGVLAGALPGACPQASLPAEGYLAPAAGLLSATALAGHITPILDPDGAVRQVPGLLCYQGKSYLSLPLAGAWAALQDASVPHLEPGKKLTDPAWWLTLGDWRMPLDAQGRYRVSYQVPRSGWVSVSAVDVLEGKVPGALLRGGWALVGATAFGAGDVVPTPQGGAVGGVEVHAQTLAALLDDRTPYTPRLASLWPWSAGLLISLGLLGVLAKTRRSVGLGLPFAGGASLALLYGIHGVLLLSWHWWLDWTIPALYTVLATLWLSGFELVRVRFERERLYHHLSSYLPAAVAREVACQGPSAQVQALCREATVLFVDLRNFSAYCEGRPPEETATLLHLFYTTATRVVEGFGGVVEQMVGDGLMAVWNGSEPCIDHGRQGLAAARDLWDALGAQLPHLSSQRMPPLDVGMGMESGTVLIGSFGPAQRRVHTVLGETVSVAAALQAMTGELAYPILLGPQLVALAQPKEVQALGQFLLPGLARPRVLHALSVPMDPRRLRLVYEAEDRQQATA
ncbi:CHASE2 domain-containing protein [Ferrovum myxofaciens]|jgi:adenylate cyclase|uniref:CHASE2 domain-containing protein n=1 Tax=Ferrovum myxofaciens TaxID=416213 RepID=UPI0023534789|nr:adenylate/guanylate cyclase domain-containing protein [Ferrovum myxofaciens]MBU6994213.1 adenylate/guanylate cyclase domain-containing protein [Ferrovum myxofaciens]